MKKGEKVVLLKSKNKSGIALTINKVYTILCDVTPIPKHLQNIIPMRDN
jgi:hypothetical protein